MSGKHKRPFYVFAVVAAICSLVLVTGMRGKAAPPPAPDKEVAKAPVSATVNSAGVTIEQLARAVDARVLDTQLGPILGDNVNESGAPSSSGGTGGPGDTTPSPEGTSTEPPDPGTGDIEGGETPLDPSSPETEDVDDEGDVIETRPEGDDGKSQTNVPNPDPDGDPEGEDTDTDTDEEETGPLDETDGPSDEGDGYTPEDQPENQGDGQSEGQPENQPEGQDGDDGLGEELVEDLGAAVDQNVIPRVPGTD